MHRLRRLWPILFFALLPLFPLWRAVFFGESIGPFDQIRQMSPWKGPVADLPWDALQADAVLQFHPWRDLVFESWRSGHLPLWNPYELAGAPLLANSQSAGLYPPHILIGVLHVPTSAGMTLLAWFHLAWAGLGVFLLTRRLGGSRIGAAMGGASFTLSAFMLAWTALPSVVETVSWIPWMLAAVFWLFQNSRLVSLESAKPFALLALATGMMFLGGHLQFSAYGTMATVLVLLWLGIANLKVQRFTGTVGLAAMGLGGLIASPQLIPVLDYSKFSHRKGMATEEGYRAYVAGALEPFELTTVATPTLLGNPRMKAVGAKVPVSAYWPQFVKPGANFAESAFSLGPVVVFLLVLVPFRRQGVGALACLGLFALLIAAGTPLNRLLYFGLPGWSASGSPARIEVLFVLAACSLAGLSLPFRREVISGPKRVIVGLAVLLPLLGIAVWLAGAPFNLASNVGLAFPIQFAGLSCVPSAGLGAFAAAALWLRSNHQIFTKLCLIAPIVAAAGFCFDLIPTGQPLGQIQADPHARIAVINTHWNIFQTPRATLPPNTASLNRVHELGGYDSLLHVDTVRFLKGVDGQDPAPPENGNMMLIKPSADPGILAAAGVTEVWQMGPRGDIQKFPLQGPGRASTPQAIAEIVEESCEGITVRATGPGPLTLRDRNMPGWTAELDGNAAPIKEGFWRVVDVPAGEHTVAFKYRPRGVNLWPISVIPVAMFGCFLV